MPFEEGCYSVKNYSNCRVNYNNRVVGETINEGAIYRVSELLEAKTSRFSIFILIDIVLVPSPAKIIPEI